MSNGFMLTTHSAHNPLVVALGAIGQQIIHCESLNEVGERLQGCIGYYGELFSEIKQPASFLELRRKLRARRIPYVFWNRDAPWNVGMKKHREWFLRFLKPVDIYLAHSLQEAHWFSRSAAIYFPNAARPDYCRETLPADMRDPASYRYDVCFFGAIGNTKRRNCRERNDFLNALQERVALKSKNVSFRIIDTVHNPLDVNSQLALIRSSKINLNLGAMCDLPGNPSWGMPERVFGIAAAGGFLLTDWRDVIPDTFDADTCDYFQDIDECMQKILYYLPRFDLLRERAERLHAQVLAQHTYENRAYQLLELLHKHARRLAT